MPSRRQTATRDPATRILHHRQAFFVAHKTRENCFNACLFILIFICFMPLTTRCVARPIRAARFLQGELSLGKVESPLLFSACSAAGRFFCCGLYVPVCLDVISTGEF